MSEIKTVPVFECEVRHGGNVMHSILKEDVTDREIRVLKAIHGDDGVVNVKRTGEKEVDQQEEAFELALRYSKTSNPRWGKALVERVLGVDLGRMTSWMHAREQKVEAEREAKHQERQREASRFAAARAAADAQVRAQIAQEALQ